MTITSQDGVADQQNPVGRIEAYPAKNLNFGQAIQALKHGEAVAREGWNGKGMFLVLAGGYEVGADKLREDSHITKEFLAKRGVPSMQIGRHIDMWTAQNNYVPGWLASQTDMLAEDWCIVEP